MELEDLEKQITFNPHSLRKRYVESFIKVGCSGLLIAWKGGTNISEPVYSSHPDYFEVVVSNYWIPFKLETINLFSDSKYYHLFFEYRYDSNSEVGWLQLVKVESADPRLVKSRRISYHPVARTINAWVKVLEPEYAEEILSARESLSTSAEAISQLKLRVNILEREFLRSTGCIPIKEVYMAKCSSCDHNLIDRSAKFCSQCGSAIPEVQNLPFIGKLHSCGHFRVVLSPQDYRSLLL